MQTTSKNNMRFNPNVSYENLIALLDNSTDLIWSVDTDIRLVFANQAILNLYQDRNITLKPGTNMLNIGPHPRQDVWETLYQQALNGKSPHIELKYGPNTYEIYFNPIQEPTGEISGVACISRDITAHIITEEALEAVNEALNQHVDDIAILNLLAQTLSALTDLHTALSTVSETLIRLLKSHSVIIALNELPEETLQVAIHYPSLLSPSLKSQNLTPSETHFLHQALKNKADLARFTPSDLPPGALKMVLQAHHTKHCALVPLVVGGQTIGLILINRPPNKPTFNPAESHLAQTIANQVAGVLQTIRHLQSERHQRQIAESLNGVAHSINSSLDLETVLAKIMAELPKLIQGDGFSLIIPQNDGSLIIDRASGLAKQYLGQRITPNKLSPVKSILATQKPRIVDDVLQESDWEVWDVNQPIRAWMGVPLLVNQRVLGILSVDSLSPNRYTQNDIHTLQLFANQATTALENARLFHAEQEQRQITERQNHDLDAFAHMVAHDLKNPLSQVVGFANYLASYATDTDPEQMNLLLNKIATAGQRAINITDEMLLLASLRRIDDVPLQPINMGAILKLVEKWLEPSLREHQGELILPKSWPMALGYAPWLEAVWYNYLSNGLKYGGSPPTLILGATPQNNGFVRFWVQDNGPGLPPDMQTLVFEEFTRLNHKISDGHGIGLSIVQRIIAKLGGEVGVTLREDDQSGCVFYFTLPALPPHHKD